MLLNPLTAYRVPTRRRDFMRSFCGRRNDYNSHQCSTTLHSIELHVEFIIISPPVNAFRSDACDSKNASFVPRAFVILNGVCRSADSLPSSPRITVAHPSIHSHARHSRSVCVAFHFHSGYGTRHATILSCGADCRDGGKSGKLHRHRDSLCMCFFVPTCFVYNETNNSIMCISIIGLRVRDAFGWLTD